MPAPLAPAEYLAKRPALTCPVRSDRRFLFLERHEQAQSHLSRAAAALRNRKKSRTIALGNLARSYLRQGELDTGVAILHTVINETARTRGGGSLNSIFCAGREVHWWRYELAVQDIHDRLFGLIAAEEGSL